MSSENNKKNKKNRKWWFRGIKCIMRLFIKKPKFTYLGESIKDGSVILSNHVGTKVPLGFELYFNQPFRFWGAHEMNGGLISVYKYQSKVYYHQKKHWNLFWARLFCLIATPLTFIFYKGLNLISTYSDQRFRSTLKKSMDALNNGESLIIFPEDSSTGYHDTILGFFGGFAVLCNMCYKRGRDLPIYVTYLKKENKEFIIDKPIMFSELVKDGFDKEKIAERLCNRLNELKDVKAD